VVKSVILWDFPHKKTPMNGIIGTTKYQPLWGFLMLRLEPKQSSFHSVLFDKIPKNHILNKISTVVDFSFINELLENSYCKHFEEPEMLCKLLFLQHLYNLSDENVRVEASLNLAFKYFIGINPEDILPDKSFLSKFRTQRLGESKLDDIITENCDTF
jgi:transposase